MIERRRQPVYTHGFSLLEALVALAILVVSLSVILGMYSTAMHAANDADAITRATRTGESLLARVGADLPLRTGIRSGGTETGLPWRITVTAAPADAGEETWQMPLRGYWVEVEVHWDSARPNAAIRLSTLRLSAGEGTSL